MTEKEKSTEEKAHHEGKKLSEQRSPSTKADAEEKKKSSPSPEHRANKPEQPMKKDKKGKQSLGTEAATKKKEYGENFNYILRMENTDINGENNIVQGLCQIKGIGRHMATFIADTAGVDRKIKFGNLQEPEIDKIKKVIDNIKEYVPAWMLNYRKDVYTGNNIHLISSDIDMRLRDDINMMKMIRSYRGIRHEVGLKVRGQRTSSNGRRGLALGVSKRREAPGAAGKKAESKGK